MLSEAFRPASLAITAELTNDENRKSAFVLVRLAINLGMSVGPAVGGILVTISYPSIFFVDGATSLLAGMVLLFSPLHFVRTRAQAARAEGRERAERGAWSDRRLWFFLFSILPCGIVFFQHEGPLPLYIVQDLKMAESFFGLMFTLNTILIIVLEVPLNLATAHWPHRRSLTLGALLTGLGFGAMILAHGPLAIMATVIIWTFGEMIWMPAMSAYVADIAPPVRRGEYMGLYSMTFGVAFGLGPWLGTTVYQRFGALPVWCGALLFGLISAALLATIGSHSEAPAIEAAAAAAEPAE
jgi:MFS family permease